MTDPPAGSDDALLARLHTGDIGAFEVLFARYHAMLCEIADAYVRSPSVSEDLVQDLFYALWKDRASLHVRGSLRSYLCVATRNRAIQHLRRSAVALRWSEEPTALDPAPDAQDDLERFELLHALKQAITHLPQRSRLAVILRWRHRLSNAEVADSMGITVKGVEKLIHSAMQRLRTEMLRHRGQG